MSSPQKRKQHFHHKTGSLPGSEKAWQLVYQRIDEMLFFSRLSVCDLSDLHSHTVLFSSGAKEGGQEKRSYLEGLRLSTFQSEQARKAQGGGRKRRGARVVSALGSRSSSLFHHFGCYFVPVSIF